MAFLDHLTLRQHSSIHRKKERSALEAILIVVPHSIPVQVAHSLTSAGMLDKD